MSFGYIVLDRRKKLLSLQIGLEYLHQLTKRNHIIITKSMNIKAIIAAGIIALSATAGHAVPAKRTPFTVTQPDGTTLTLRRVGDERLHFLLTDDDKLVVQQGSRYCYARITPEGKILSTDVDARDAVRRTVAQDALTTSLSDVDVPKLLKLRDSARKPHVKNFKPVGIEPRRSARKGKSRSIGNYTQKGMGRFTSTFPRTGKIKGLVLLVEYSDVKFNNYYSTSAYQYFSDLLNKDDFSEYDATGSAVQYFREQSMGQFDPEFVVVGPITLSQKRSYYGENDAYGDDLRPGEMVAEACRLADGQINFADFDNDKDGIVDNVFVFYAGTGEASGGLAETIWPHSWDLASCEIELSLDGVKIDSYACTNELNSGLPDGIGTFCHEFSHVMGLPDLYVTSGRGNWTPNEYSVLDYGPYNNDSRTPPAYSAYERNAMGWLEPIIVNSGAFITLDDIKSSNRALLIPTATETEFYLFENRQQTGWDTYIPGHGMLVWHIDYKTQVFDDNRVNNSRNHNYVDIIEANETPGYNYDGYTWPGTTGKTEFSYTSSPQFRDWSNNDLNYPLTEIRENNGQITFNVRGGNLPAPVSVEPIDKGADYFVAAWNPVNDATDYLLTVLGSNTKQPPFEDIATFGLSTDIVLPTGWTTDVTEAGTASGSVGNAAPSLVFNTDGQYLQTREYDSDISYISFWSSCTGTMYYTSTFTVRALVNGEWQDVYIASPARGGSVTNVELPAGSRCVRIEYTKGAGVLNLDDVKVHSDGVCDVIVGDYNRKSTSGATSVRINTEGLPYDLYKYYVQSTDGNAVSGKSGEISVSMQAGVEDIVADGGDESLVVTAVGTAITIYTDADKAHVYDAVGRPVATARVSDGGIATVTVPSAGFYIVTAGSQSAKIAVR